MNSKRISLFTAAALVAIGLFGAQAAQANTYRALSPGDPDTGSCSTTHTNTATAVVEAVTDARNNPGPDTVRIGPGEFTAPSAISLEGSGTGNTVTITGQGAATILSVADSEAPTITFDAGAGSSLNDVTIKIPASATPAPKEGLVVRNSFDGEPPVVRNLDMYVAGGGESRNLYAVVLYSGSDLDNSSVDVHSANYFTGAVKANGSGSDVSRTYMAGNLGAIQNVTEGDMTISRSEINATGHGVQNASGLLYVKDSLIVLSSGNAQAAVQNTGGNTGSGDLYLNGSTVIANAGSGIKAMASEGAANANVFFDNSVLAGAAGTIELTATNPGDSVYFGSDSGAFDSTKISTSGSGDTFIDPVDVIDLSAVSPGFADAGAGDYRLAPGSALIDSGQDVDPAEGALDYQGYPRACHGKADGVIRRDIGAFEFKTDPADDCTYPETSILAGPQSPTGNLTPSFTFATTKNPGTYLCSWDGGPETGCTFNATAPDLGLGPHTVSVRARDQYGNIDQSPESFDYEVIENVVPTCDTDPSLCPKDTTAPKVTGVKAPKKTKAARVKVRFKSNEKGSTFKCRLNKGKWKSCKSPWKTPKLRKGKNSISIQATDKAGNKSKVVKRNIKRSTGKGR
ncbi:MAG: hypothetical protein KDB52_03185 [Solirubrobacterales bacterium]|nr:hypothetical protein [Solirubrobacterales bacterium]